MQKNINRPLVFYITFFSFSGYYIGLALLLYTGYGDMSRMYSVPLRLTIMVSSIYLIYSFRKNFKKTHTNYLYPILAFWFLYFILIFLSNPEQNLTLPKIEYLFYTMGYSILPLITYSIIPLENYKNTIIKAVLYSGFILSIMSIILYYDDIKGLTPRLGVGNDDEVYLNSLALGYTAALTISITTWCIINKNLEILSIKILIAILLFSTIPLLLGASRGSIMVLLITAIFLFRKTSLKKTLSLVFIFTIFTIFIFYLVENTGSALIERFTNISSDINDDSDSAIRIHIWKSTLNSFLISPIIGGTFEIDGNYPHNFILEILASTGLLGSLFFFLPFILLLKKSINNRDGYYWITIMLVNGVILYFFSGSIRTATLIFAPLGMLIYLKSKRL